MTCDRCNKETPSQDLLPFTPPHYAINPTSTRFICVECEKDFRYWWHERALVFDK